MKTIELTNAEVNELKDSLAASLFCSLTDEAQDNIIKQPFCNYTSEEEMKEQPLDELTSLYVQTKELLDELKVEIFNRLQELKEDTKQIITEEFNK